PHRHLNGLPRGGLRRLLQLRSSGPPRRSRGGRRRDRAGRGGLMDPREREVLDRIEAKRRRPHVKLLDEQITLAHGAGGKASHTLIAALFLRELSNPLLEPLGDNVIFQAGNGAGARLAFSTDSYVVKPLFFP